jgi:trimeric autotransporter adhesin
MAGYTRNDTGNNIADGNVINAADLDGEFDSIQTAFNETSGHTHDGTVGEGAPISVVGPAQDINVTITEVAPKTTNTMSLGTAALQFKDLYIDGTANIDSLVADTADINAGTIDGTTIGASTPAAITGTSITATGNIAVAGTVDGRDVATDGTKLDTIETNADVTDTANVTAAGALMDSELTNITAVKALDQGVATTDSPSFAGLTATTADINGGTIDNATIATSNITVGAGKTLDVSAGTLTLANDQISGDKVQGGTIGSTTITTLTGTTANVTNVNATTVDTTNIEATNIKAKDGTAAATIADATGVVTIPSAVLTTADINGGTIDNATIATSDVTVGAGKTLDVSAGTLTLANDQISGDKIQGGTIGSTTITTLTGTTGNITNVNATTVDTTNIEATNIKAKDGTASATIANSTGVMTVASSVLTTTDINGGTIDGVTIGGASAGAGTFTSVTGTSLNMNGAAVFNETGADVDFRIESDTNANAFFLQGSDGRIGIGTASPLQPLHVNSNGNTQLLISSTFNNSTNTGLTVDTVGDNAVFRFNVSKSGVTQGTFKYLHAPTAANQAWQFTASTSTVYEAGYSEHIWKTGNTERMRINSSGNVGIGTSSPAAKLHIEDDAGSAFRVENITNTSFASSLFVDDTGAGLTITNYGSAYASGSLLNVGAGGVALSSTTDMAINASGAKTLRFGTNSTERLRIDSSGNVIIGATSVSNPNGYGAVLNIEGYAPALVLSEDTGRDYTIGVNGNNLNIFNETTNVFTITDSGSVGIATSSPRAILDLEGNAALDTDTATLTTTSQTSIATFAVATFDAAKVVITANNGTDTYITELLVAHDGTTAVATEYGQLSTDTFTVAYDVDISGGNVRILATPPAVTSTTFKVIKTLM